MTPPIPRIRSFPPLFIYQSSYYTLSISPCSLLLRNVCRSRSENLVSMTDLLAHVTLLHSFLTTQLASGHDHTGVSVCSRSLIFSSYCIGQNMLPLTHPCTVRTTHSFPIHVAPLIPADLTPPSLRCIVLLFSSYRYPP